MQLSPLQLLEYAVDSVEIRAVDGYDNAKRDPALVMPPQGMRMASDIGIAVLQEAASYSDFGLRFKLSVTAEPGTMLPYAVQVSMVGTVRMHDEPDRDKRQALALVNGISLLCGAARDVVAQITSRSRYGQMLLPTLNFAKLAEQQPHSVPASGKAIKAKARKSRDSHRKPKAVTA